MGTFTSSSSFLAHGRCDVHRGHPLHRETTNIISSLLEKNVSSKYIEKKILKKIEKVYEKRFEKKIALCPR